MSIIDNSNTRSKLATGTTAQRPGSPVNGDQRLNTTGPHIEAYYNGQWFPYGKFKDGLSAITAVNSGQELVDLVPGATAGTYWVNPGGTNTAIQMYVDVTADGGGYDFYACTGCAATTLRTQTNGCPAGTDYAAPRSKNWWSAAWNYSGNGAYFATMPGVYKTAAGSTYVSYAMRDPTAYGTGAPDWRVADGGRWWLRDTAYTEPNGDYTANGWLQNRATTQSGTGDRTFNDGGAYSTGTNYLCSTNLKT